MANKDQIEVEIVINDKQLAAGLAQSRSKLEGFRQQIAIDQQQIAGLAAQQTTDVFRNVAGQMSRFTAQQKAQLSFQVNDVLTGLASGQNITQIIAQQAGQIVQIFQQAKLAQEGTVVATQALAVSQGQVAVSAQATAASMEAASVSATVLGASVVSLGAILAAGLVTILAVWRATTDIAEAAQKRLKREKEITGEYNRQNLALADLSKKIREATAARSFGAFSGGDDILGLNTGLTTRQQERTQLAADVQRKQAYANFLVTNIPNLPKNVLEAAFPKAEEARLKKLDEEILSITDRLAGLKAEQAKDYRYNLIEGAMRNAASVREADIKAAVDANKAQLDAAKKYEQEKKKMLAESLQKAKEWVEYVKNARSTIAETFANSTSNPFVKIWSDSEKALDNVIKATGRLKGGLSDTLTELIKNRTAAQEFGQSLANALKARGLRTDAGNIAKGSVEEEAKRRLFANYFTKEGREADLQRNIKRITEDRQRNDLAEQFRIINQGRSIGESEEIRRRRNQEIIAATQGLTGAQLGGFKNDAIRARLDEAKALDNEKAEAKKLKEREVAALEQVEKYLKNSQHIVRVIDEANRAETYQTPAQSDVNKLYPTN